MTDRQNYKDALLCNILKWCYLIVNNGVVLVLQQQMLAICLKLILL
jgi:hypothetical protein